MPYRSLPGDPTGLPALRHVGALRASLAHGHGRAHRHSLAHGHSLAHRHSLAHGHGRTLGLLLGLLLAVVVQRPSDAADATQVALRVQQSREFLERAAARQRLLGSDRVIAGRRFPLTVLAGEANEEDSTGRATTQRAQAGSATADDWNPYAGPFGRAEASHLLRRATFGPTLAEVNRAMRAGPQRTVRSLLQPRMPPPPPGNWAAEPLPNLAGWSDARIDSLVALYLSRNDSLRLWWAELLTGPDPGLREVMTLFWHDHFATSADKVLIPAPLYLQNQTLRAGSLGSYRRLLHAMALDPALLIWLDGNSNRVGNVNENLAREFLELFTLGLGPYTEADVRAAARAWTGYVSYDGVHVEYVDAWHDHGMKTFLGRTGNFGPHEIVDVILERPEAAAFIVRKLYRAFVDEHPTDASIADLAASFRAGNYAIGPLMLRLLTSRAFFDADHRGCLYTDALDRGVGLVRAFELGPLDLDDHGGPQAQWVFASMHVLGEVLLNPPSVAGWPGYRSWLNSYTLGFRRVFAQSLLDGNLLEMDIGVRADLLALADQVENPDDPEALVDGLCATYLGLPPTPAVRARLLGELLAGMSTDEWSLGHPDAPRQLDRLFRLMVCLPDFQLK